MNKNSEVKIERNNGEVIIYSVVGGYILLSFAPALIPTAICYAGLCISLCGIYDVLKNSNIASDFDIDNYLKGVCK